MCYKNRNALRNKLTLKLCFNYLDINECQTDNGGCTQTCGNTDGSYQCSCLNGYELNNDGYTCTGKFQLYKQSRL